MNWVGGTLYPGTLPCLRYLVPEISQGGTFYPGVKDKIPGGQDKLVHLI